MSERVHVDIGAPFGLFTLTFVVLLTLKLLGEITLAWVWVFAPLWIGAALGVLGLLVFLLVAWGLSR